MSFSPFYLNDLIPSRDPFFRDPFLTGQQLHLTDPFFVIAFNSQNTGRQLAVDISEQGDTYFVMTEVPGFKKENVDIKVGDRGLSLTVSGKQETPATGPNNEGGQSGSSRTNETIEESPPEAQFISAERPGWKESSTFSRTIWLPSAVDATKVTAKLEDGILRVSLPKAVDNAAVTVNVE